MEKKRSKGITILASFGFVVAILVSVFSLGLATILYVLVILRLLKLQESARIDMIRLSKFGIVAFLFASALLGM